MCYDDIFLLGCRWQMKMKTIFFVANDKVEWGPTMS